MAPAAWRRSSAAGPAIGGCLPSCAGRRSPTVRSQYEGFGPTLAHEKLTERRGELIQIDGCEHAWFEERAAPCTLLVFVDDATSALMELLFCESESAFSYFAAMRAYLEQHGKPVALYSDKAGVFRVNRKEAHGGAAVTQFGRALDSLNIDILCANTPQAKGRVERAHLTLQDRLVKELRLRGISDPEAANAYAPEFMGDYNRRFARAPALAAVRRSGPHLQLAGDPPRLE